MMKLDKTDQLLISALQQNARASLVSLARDINRSRSTTHDRILRLEENGIIQGYTVVLGADQMPAKAVFSVIFKAGLDNRTIAKRLFRLPGVRSTHCLTGNIDMIVHAACASIDELSKLRERISCMDEVSELRTYTELVSLGI